MGVFCEKAYAAPYSGWMRALIRRIETTQIEVSGEGLPDVQSKLSDATPAGFDLVSAPVAMKSGSTAITAVGTYARRDEVREIEGATMAELRAATPEGWQTLYMLSS